MNESARIWKVAQQVLTEKQWDAFVLRYGAEQPVARIAEALGISQQAVRERLFASKRKVRKGLDERKAA